jgi:dienelactone hydrolase
MRKLLLGIVAAALASTPAFAGMVTEKVGYELDGTTFEGILVYDDGVQAKRPAIVMAPNWMGVTANAVTKAKLLAGDKYVFFIADMYGARVRPKNSKEAGAAAGSVGKDLAMHRARINRAVDVALAEAGKRNLIDASKVAAIGFCFGGGNVLELARSGRDVKAVVSFHGSLTTPTPEDAKNIKAKVLVLHGADDPAAPKAQRDALEAELTAAKVDYQLVVFSNTVHSFTNPQAKRPGRSMYNATVAKRAYSMMYSLFDEVF